ncbi:NifU family protein [Candidatus Babeliales bacterium]|nr:NifU family protein [Candidatus Babeliales bacterium]
MGQIDSSNNQEIIIDQIQQVLVQLQPYVQSHGGKIEFVKLQDLVVYIKFYGACVQCPMSFYTVTYGIERHIKHVVPNILRVEVIEE